MNLMCSGETGMCDRSTGLCKCATRDDGIPMYASSDGTFTRTGDRGDCAFPVQSWDSIIAIEICNGV